jgi:hypothetical protein
MLSKNRLRLGSVIFFDRHSNASRLPRLLLRLIRARWSCRGSRSNTWEETGLRRECSQPENVNGSLLIGMTVKIRLWVILRMENAVDWFWLTGRDTSEE